MDSCDELARGGGRFRVEVHAPGNLRPATGPVWAAGWRAAIAVVSRWAGSISVVPGSASANQSLTAG